MCVTCIWLSAAPPECHYFQAEFSKSGHVYPSTDEWIKKIGYLEAVMEDYQSDIQKDKLEPLVGNGCTARP